MLNRKPHDTLVKSPNPFSPADDDKCKNCDAILAELENIDDEADDAGIHFVKTTDTAFAKGLGIHAFPTVVYFEDSVPIVYNGEGSRGI